MIMPFQCLYCINRVNLSCPKHGVQFPKDIDEGTDCGDLTTIKSDRKRLTNGETCWGNHKAFVDDVCMLDSHFCEDERKCYNLTQDKHKKRTS